MNPTTDICRVCGEPVSLHDSAIQFENCRPAHKSCLLAEAGPVECGKRLHGFMPPCVLHVGHAGACNDGFGGHYQHGDSQPTTTKETPCKQ